MTTTKRQATPKVTVAWCPVCQGSVRVPVTVAEAQCWAEDWLLEKYEGLALGVTDIGVAIYRMFYSSDGEIKVCLLGEEETRLLALLAAMKEVE